MQPTIEAPGAGGLAPERWSERELLILREMSKLLGKTLEPGFAIREALHLLSELVGLNRGRVLLPDPGSGLIGIRYAYGLTSAEMARGRFMPGEGVTGRAFQTGETVIVQDIDAEPAFLARTVERARLPQETVSFIALPFVQDGRVAGVLAAHRLRRRDRALSDDVQLLRVVASWIAQILKINQLVEKKTAALESENRALKTALTRNVSSYGIVGESAPLKDALRQIEQVSETDATILLLGDSGTGKELFARALHLASPRRDAPFIRINCGAIPESLFESELFGHEKGAFTGATAGRAGRFEQAEGGTVFLDEIGDLPLAMQVKLLRVLQERVIERVGGAREVPVDIRVVAATHQDLQQLVAQGRFRLDLYYRLNVIPVRLPSLRERPEDIPMLVRYHLNQINQTYRRDVSLAQGGFDLFTRYAWPGNVRQLRNVLERMVLLARHNIVEAGEVEGLLAQEANDPSGATPVPPALLASAAATSGGTAVRHYRRSEPDDMARIEAALAACGGNKSRAAQHLGMTLRQFNYRLAKLRGA
jgi:Nif-specific regulatory protein